MSKMLMYRGVMVSEVQFRQHLVLGHLLQGDELRANNRLCHLNDFIWSVCVLCFGQNKSD